MSKNKIDTRKILSACGDCKSNIDSNIPRIVAGVWGDGRSERYALRHDAIAVIRPPVRSIEGQILAGYLLCRNCEAQFAFTDKVNSYYAAFDAFLAHTCKRKS